MTETPAAGATAGGPPPTVAAEPASTGRPPRIEPRAEPRIEPDRASTVPTPTSVTGWVGWVVFAATMLVLLGGFQVLDGIVALFRDELYVVRPDGLVVSIDYTVLGLFQLAIGGLLLAVGFALLAGRTWARVLAIVVAVVSALVNFAFAPAYPFWSMLIIAVDVIVIYALAAHGGEMKLARGGEYA